MANSHAKIEVEFWTQLFNQLGEKNFFALRKDDFFEKTKHFRGELGDITKEDGSGLDLGCALVSIFEFSNFPESIIAVDPLHDEYEKIHQFRGLCDYRKGDGENLMIPSKSLDFVFCCNVHDHTPNPSAMLSEIRRVLKPGGRLYYQVNFDDYLSPAHYGLWDMKRISEVFKDWEPVNHVIERNEMDKQSIFNAVFVL